ncbi:MAG: phosphatase PAP2 family protein [Lachnospiraceae bacterium]|nr:phosphatase PAP2 family protein [Lachnospiraceae bacterium]
MNKKILTASVTGVLFLILIAMVKFVDVAAIGPAGTSIGLSHLNGAVHSLIGEHELWYSITEILGYASFLIAGLFALVGLLQLISSRSLFGVDKEIFLLGCLYVVVIGLYILFEVLVINYRPVLTDGLDFPEASFPSSHTLLAFVILGSAAMLVDRYVRSKAVARIFKIILIAALVIIVVGRLISGVHWFTDICGGVLLGLTLINVYGGCIGDE